MTTDYTAINWTLTWDVFKCGFKNKNLLLICIEH